MTILVILVLTCVAIPAVFASGYLFLLTILSSAAKPAARSSQQLRFDVIVPAHNEAAVIERTVVSLKKIDWPVDRFRIRVVADNCNDNTADIARDAGANVLERHNTTLRGKGYALAYAFEASANEKWADAVVVVDADSEVSPNLLEAFATRIEQGAGAIQAHYGVLNPMVSWRTRLMTIALGAIHKVRSRAREKLGASCGIRGNGWCMTHRTLLTVPYDAFSLTEDIEYGIKLGLGGIQVRYADEAHVLGEMVSGESSARKQRQRWEHGRFELIRAKTPVLLSAAFKHNSIVCFDLAADLLVLPLSYIVINVAAFTLLAGAATYWQPQFSYWLWAGFACSIALILYVLRGWQLSGVGTRGLIDLARAPGFLAWKLLLMLRRDTPTEWVRTDREIK